MSNIDERKHISRYLKNYGLSPEELHLLIAAVFRGMGYVDLAPGAPGGGPDRGMDCLYISDKNTGTIWCITSQEAGPNLLQKLKNDALQKIRTFRELQLSKLDTIYLCTCRKLSNNAFVKISQAVYEERDKLASRGETGLSELKLKNVDCDFLALSLTTEESLKSEKDALLDLMRRGLVSCNIVFFVK